MIQFLHSHLVTGIPLRGGYQAILQSWYLEWGGGCFSHVTSRLHLLEMTTLISKYIERRDKRQWSDCAIPTRLVDRVTPAGRVSKSNFREGATISRRAMVPTKKSIDAIFYFFLLSVRWCRFQVAPNTSDVHLYTLNDQFFNPSLTYRTCTLLSLDGLCAQRPQIMQSRDVKLQVLLSLF